MPLVCREEATTQASTLIASRRSVRSFEARAVPPALIERCIETAVWAPNRGLTQPWSFAVLRGSARARLTAAVAAFEARSVPEPGQGGAGPLAAAPVALAVGCATSADAQRQADDRLAVAAAVQNLLLCAWDEALAGLWVGGPLLHDGAVRLAAQLLPDAELLALVALGYPEAVPPVPRRRHGPAVTRWFGDPAYPETPQA